MCTYVNDTHDTKKNMNRYRYILSTVSFQLLDLHSCWWSTTPETRLFTTPKTLLIHSLTIETRSLLLRAAPNSATLPGRARTSASGRDVTGAFSGVNRDIIGAFSAES